MSKQIWFGIPNGKMQWCPAPLAAPEVLNINYVSSIAFENGGADIARSKQYRKQYNFSFSGLSEDLDGIGVYNKYASGFYGDGLFYFSDPYAWETNLFPAAWASPMIIEHGWQTIADSEPSSFSATASNVYNQPEKSALFNVTGVISPANAGSSVYIVIPPTHTLHMGYSGSVTGAGAVTVVPINPDGSNAAAVNLTPLDPAGATRMNASFAGSSYQAVRVYLRSTAGGTSTVRIASMMARMVETGKSIALTGNHMAGEGHTGLEFADDARVETYTYMYPPRKAMSTTLVEVGAWR